MQPPGSYRVLIKQKAETVRIYIKMALNLAIINKGEDCMALVESVSNDIARGCVGSTIEEKLRRLERSGKELAEQAEERAKEMEIVEQQYKQKVEEIQRRIGEVGVSEEQTKEKMFQLSSATMSDFFTPLALKLHIDIKNLKRQRMHYNSEAEKMKGVVLFFRKASQFWKEFQEISRRGSNRAELVQNIVRKAKAKYDIDSLTFLNSSATKRVGTTFFEAWKLIETRCAEGSQFVFKLDMCRR